MYKKTLLLLVFVFSCLLSSCRAKRQEIQKTETQTKVTSEKLVTYKDTTLFAPKAETNLKIPLSELVFKNPLNANSKPIVYTQQNGQAKVKLKIVHDTIQVFATCDSLAIVAKIKSEFQKENENTNTNNNRETIEKRGFTFWNIIIAFLLGFALCYLLKFSK
jgi:uncharacterized membrane protein